MSDIVEFWRQYDEMEARLSRPLSDRMLELARVSAGMHVLDAACGRGAPSMPTAKRVGPHGRVLAIDQNEGVLQMARENAAREALRNIEFRVADGETFDTASERFDVATVRWALMYMRDPERALRAIHRALKPGGALVIASWVDADWAVLPRKALSRFCELPPLDTNGPGIFRHADAAVLNGLLQRSGFAVEVAEERGVPIVEAPDARGIIAWVRQLGGLIIDRLNELAPNQQQDWERELSAALERHHVGDRIVVGGVTRITVARRG